MLFARHRGRGGNVHGDSNMHIEKDKYSCMDRDVNCCERNLRKIRALKGHII